MTVPLKRFIEPACDGAQIGNNPTGKRPGLAAGQPDRPKRIPMAAKKKRKPKLFRPTDRPMPVVSTAVGSLINMTVTVACTDLAKARAIRTAKAQNRASDLAPTIRQLQAEGVCSLRQLAAILNAKGITAARGGNWSAAQVRSVVRRFGD